MDAGAPSGPDCLTHRLNLSAPKELLETLKSSIKQCIYLNPLGLKIPAAMADIGRKRSIAWY